MTDPIDLNARRGERVPEPDGEPDIRMPMDSDQIIFHDQAALDEYVAGACADKQARIDKALALADWWTTEYVTEVGWPTICANQLREALGGKP